MIRFSRPLAFVLFAGIFNAGLVSAAGLTFTEKHLRFGADSPLLSGSNYVVARMSDLNNDGVADLLVGEPNFNNNTGRVRVLSGLDGCLIGTANSTLGSGSRFGDAVVDVGDINGDGFPDFAAGAPIQGSSTPGQVKLFSGVLIGGNFASFHAINGTGSGDNFGDALAAVDLNGDGVRELIVGAPQKPFSSVSQKGLAHVYNLATYVTGGFVQLKITLIPSSSSDGNTDFGDTLTTIGDLNGDSRPEIVVGAPWDSAVSTGFVEVFSGLAAFQGSSIQIVRIDVPQDSGSQGGPQDFARSLAGLGDVNGDGRPDLGVAAPSEDVSGSNNAGTVRIFSIVPSGGGFQSSTIYKLVGSKSIHANLGDVFPFGSPDGRTDLLVGQGDGSVVLLDGSSSGLVKVFSSGQVNNVWGMGVQAMLGDLNGDGFPEFAVAGTGSIANVATLSLNLPSPPHSLAVDKFSLSIASGGIVNLRMDGGPIVGGKNYFLLASISGISPGVTLTSPYAVHIPLNLDAVTNTILAAPNSPPWANGFGTLDALGQAQASLTLPSGLTVPFCLHHVFVVLDGSLRVQGASNPVVTNILL